MLKTTKIILLIFVIITAFFLPTKIYSKDNLQYTIMRVDNSPQGKARRFTYHVVIHPGTTKKEMEQISLRVLEYAKKENPFNALAVGFYDYSVLLGHGFRFGRVEFAPNGKWTDAATVKTGDYSSLKMVNYLKEPDWDNALTKKEATIYAKHNKLLNSLLKKATSREDIEKVEKEAEQEILKKYKITQDELNDIYSRYR
ncbi:MAG: hypothetical protein FWF38_06585 [Spirochaetaceae bacterium]|nr:hypothetical protein [Spirochaetaceae bacterium]